MKKIVSAFLVVLAMAGLAVAGGKSYGNTDCKFIKNYDGDTITVTIKGYPAIIGKKIGVRVNGIDTPELKGTKGRVKKLARAAKKLTASLCGKAKRLELRNMRRGKYFRIVADVYVDGRNLAAVLIKNGLAKPYDGGKKPKW